MLTKFLSYLLKNQILLIFFIVVTGWLVFQIRNILVLIFLSYIIMAALIPYVDFLQRRGLPKIVSVMTAYLSVVIVIFLIVYPLVLFTTAQVQVLFKTLPIFIYESSKTLGLSINSAEVEKIITSEFQNIGKNAYSVGLSVFGGVLSVVTGLIIGFYLLLYHDRIKQNVSRMFHKTQQEVILKTLYEVDDKLGAWLRGQLVLSFAVGSVTFVTLAALRVPLAFPLAVLAGLLEVIPMIGPLIAAIPAVIIAMSISPSLGVFVIILYVIIQLLENNILVPKIMQKSVGLNPVVVIIGVLIGGKLMGILGALISIPLISMIIVIFNNLKIYLEDNPSKPSQQQ